MTTTFALTDKEQEKARAWQVQHLPKCGPFPEVSGARWMYSFIPSGIGIIVRVQCLKCREEHDCTDYGLSLDELRVRRCKRS